MVNKDCHLTFGWTELIPIQYLNENGKPQGLQIELVTAITKEMGCRLSFVKGNWSNILGKLERGEIDFMANATKTNKRQSFGLFSNVYRKDVFTLYVRKGDLEKYQSSSFEQLKQNQFELGLTRDFLYGDEVAAWQKNKKYNQYLSYRDSTEENARRLVKGEIDGFLEDPYIVSYKLISNELSDSVAKLPISLFGKKTHFMFSKNNVDINTVKQFNLALEKTLRTPRFYSSWLTLETD